MASRKRTKTNPAKPKSRLLFLFVLLPVLLLMMILVQQRQNLVQYAAGNVLLDDNFEAYSFDKWKEGTTNGNWKNEFNGYGKVGIETDGTNVLYEKPKAPVTTNETHASLVTTTRSFGDLDLALRMKTIKQLRLPTPNPWETAWVFWNYTDNTHFYYLALKTNGWELGKEDPAYPGSQRFLVTGSTPVFQVGTWYNIRITQQNNIISVFVNGNTLTSFIDNEHPYLTGKVGLYNEDAYVHFDDILIQNFIQKPTNIPSK